MAIVFILIIVIYLFYSTNLLLSLLVLEMLSFVVLVELTIETTLLVSSDFLTLVVFTIFVIEGVIGLAGLIALVSFTGSDYVRSSSLIKC
jgi:hypothetical protein